MATAKPSAKQPVVCRSISLSKGKHSYVFKYEQGDENVVLDTLSEMARRKDVAFDWFDAAVLSHQLGQHLTQELQAFLPKK